MRIFLADVAQVPESQWCVPTDCKRFAKKVAEEGFCFGNHCDTCDRLFGSDDASSHAVPHSSPPHESSAGSDIGTEPASPARSASSGRGSTRTAASAEVEAWALAADGWTIGTSASQPLQQAEVPPADADLLMLESTRLVHCLLSSEGLLGTSSVPGAAEEEIDLSQLSQLLAYDELCSHATEHDDETSES